jgi:hypothetical protein
MTRTTRPPTPHPGSFDCWRWDTETASTALVLRASMRGEGCFIPTGSVLHKKRKNAVLRCACTLLCYACLNFAFARATTSNYYARHLRLPALS